MVDLPLLKFIEETNRIEGIEDYNGSVCIEAHRKFLALNKITVKDLEDFVSAIEPGAVLRRMSGQDVRVGNHLAPLGGSFIEGNLTAFLLDIKFMEAHQAHLAYEDLHPFTDGNGRSGRVLWLWLKGGTAPLGFLHQWYYDTLAAHHD